MISIYQMFVEYRVLDDPLRRGMFRWWAVYGRWWIALLVVSGLLAHVFGTLILLQGSGGMTSPLSLLAMLFSLLFSILPILAWYYAASHRLSQVNELAREFPLPNRRRLMQFSFLSSWIAGIPVAWLAVLTILLMAISTRFFRYQESSGNVINASYYLALEILTLLISTCLLVAFRCFSDNPPASLILLAIAKLHLLYFLSPQLGGFGSLLRMTDYEWYYPGLPILLGSLFACLLLLSVSLAAVWRRHILLWSATSLLLMLRVTEFAINGLSTPAGSFRGPSMHGVLFARGFELVFTQLPFMESNLNGPGGASSLPHGCLVWFWNPRMVSLIAELSAPSAILLNVIWLLIVVVVCYWLVSLRAQLAQESTA